MAPNIAFVSSYAFAHCAEARPAQEFVSASSFENGTKTTSTVFAPGSTSSGIACSVMRRGSALSHSRRSDDRYFAVVPRGSIPEGKNALTQDELAHLPLLMAPRNALGEHLDALADSQTIIDCDDDSTLLSMADGRRRCGRSGRIWKRRGTATHANELQ